MNYAFANCFRYNSMCVILAIKVLFRQGKTRLFLGLVFLRNDIGIPSEFLFAEKWAFEACFSVRKNSSFLLTYKRL